jgi:UDP-2,3-diacylglucosamine pyrophosphatase LpxH
MIIWVGNKEEMVVMAMSKQQVERLQKAINNHRADGVEIKVVHGDYTDKLDASWAEVDASWTEVSIVFSDRYNAMSIGVDLLSAFPPLKIDGSHWPKLK